MNWSIKIKTKVQHNNDVKYNLLISIVYMLMTTNWTFDLSIITLEKIEIGKKKYIFFFWFRKQSFN